MFDIMLRLSDFGFQFNKTPVDMLPTSVQSTLMEYDLVISDKHQHTLSRY